MPGHSRHDDARGRERESPLRALAGRVAQGDESAFEAIHARLTRGLEQYFLKRNGGVVHAAEELVHRTWVIAWRAFQQGRYDPDRAAVSTFVYAIALRVWMQACRDAHRSRTAPVALYDPPANAATDPADLSGNLHQAELLDALRECLQGPAGGADLTDEERALLVEFSKGASLRELGRRLGVSASTVHERKAAALEKLRVCLHAKGFD